MDRDINNFYKTISRYAIIINLIFRIHLIVFISLIVNCLLIVSRVLDFVLHFTAALIRVYVRNGRVLVTISRMFHRAAIYERLQMSRYVGSEMTF